MSQNESNLFSQQTEQGFCVNVLSVQLSVAIIARKTWMLKPKPHDLKNDKLPFYFTLNVLHVNRLLVLRRKIIPQCKNLDNLVQVSLFIL